MAQVNKSKKKTVVSVKKKEDTKRVEATEDCFILEFDPYDDESLNLSNLSLDDARNNRDPEISVVTEKGKVACRDYPHSRHLCVKFPFTKTPHQRCCEMCYCYVCDSVAPCEFWTHPIVPHCDADSSAAWMERRRLKKELASRNLLSQRENRLKMNCSRVSGKVKWFNEWKGFGFIIPDGGGDDLSVHQFDIKFQGFQYLVEGESVEFIVNFYPNGRAKAVDVTLPDRGGTGTCYRCGEEGHFARDCDGSSESSGYGGRGGDRGGSGACDRCGKEGHFARDCDGSSESSRYSGRGL